MSRFERRLLKFLETLMACTVLIIALTVVLQVALNFFWNSSITGANEVITKLFVYVSTIGSAVVIGRQEHISITFAVEKLPRAALPTFRVGRLLAVALLNAMVVIYSFPWISVTGGYLMPITQLPRIWAQVAVPVGAGLSVLFCVLQLIRTNSARQSTEEAG